MAYKDKSDIRVRKFVLEKYDSKCAYCGIEISLETMSVDHIIPLRRKSGISVEGLNEIQNFNPSCRQCNSSKGSKELEEWRYLFFNKFQTLENTDVFKYAIRFGLISRYEKPGFWFYFERLERGWIK